MSRCRVISLSLAVCAFAGFLVGCGGGTMASPPPSQPGTHSGKFQLTVKSAGNGAGQVSSSPAGISCGTACNATFQTGTAVKLTATPSAGSTFVGWNGDCTGNGVCTVTLDRDRSVTATFSISPVLSVSVSGTGTIASRPSGINCGQTCSAAFTSGTQVTLTATPTANATFAGWGGACSGTSVTCAVTVNANTAVSATFTATASPVLTVTISGSGTVASSPPGINCTVTCTATFSSGTVVTLTATPAAGSTFSGWGNACSGNSTCVLTLTADTSVTATFVGQGIAVLNHIIFMAQENRSFDHYFGEMRKYWADNGYPDQSFDGLPQFNPLVGQPPLYGPPPTNPGCDPNGQGGGPFSNCVVDANSPQVTSFHLITQCIENPSPFWNESHYNLNWADPYADPGNTQNPPPMNGFVSVTAHDSQDIVPPYYDTAGVRVMGYYDGGNPNDPSDRGDLNYYYFMASNFATSDRWFNPIMTRTDANRDFFLGATSQGQIYAVGTYPQDVEHTSPPIFEEVQNAGISWKVYVNPTGTGCTAPYQTSCLKEFTYLKDFQWGKDNLSYPTNLGTVGRTGTCGASPCDFENDVANGTLPQVVLIEAASAAALDEHGSDVDTSPVDIQAGANYVSGLINTVMQSPLWKDSAFILTYDEYGGIYDHVPPQPMPSPDGTSNPPIDLQPNDLCYSQSGPTCNFDWTGYRIPLIVVSPYAKKNYVSHTVADHTAILKFIETRFNLPPLSQRDAAQMDMTEFFDFTYPAWLTPPTPPVQNQGGACYLNQLP